jgi:ABC-type nitrate/sulfonate/bicarbonate transport system substrate-binding protein
VLLLAWTAWTLTRLRRLQARVDRAWTALSTQLGRRAAVADELAREHPDALDDAAERLAAAARAARTPPAGDRELAENALGRELRELPAELPGVPAALREDLAGTATRLQLARRFYNDAVRDTRELRRRRLPRLLRLHARRPLPRFFDIDDDAPGVILTAGPAADRGGNRP